MTDNSEAIEDLTISVCWALLRKVTVGRIALLGTDDEIEIFPVNFVVDHGSIVFRTAPGSKLALVHERGRSTFEADDFHEGIAWSVVAKGSTKEVKGHDAVIETFGLKVRAWQQGHKPSYVRLFPDVMTGRRFPIDPAADNTG